MEHTPHPPQSPDSDRSPDTPVGELTPEQRIQRGIADALTAQRPVDDATAQQIAAALHTGPDSAVYALAVTGEVRIEFIQELAEQVQDLPISRDSWVDALLDYAGHRVDDRAPRPQWRHLLDDADLLVEHDRARAAHQRQVDRDRLERAVGIGIEAGDAESVIEFQHLTRRERRAWAGQVLPEPGAAELAAAAQVERAHPTGLAPRIYLACLAAYTHGRLHGEWIDATQDPTELQAAVVAVLARSPIPHAEEWAIHDHADFAGYRLGEYESLAYVSALAKGIAEHGQVFAAYADWNRTADPELARFADHLDGVYPTREAWAADMADNVFDWPGLRQQFPTALAPHIRLDLTALSHDLEHDRHVVEGDDGIYVFDPHA